MNATAIAMGKVRPMEADTSEQYSETDAAERRTIAAMAGGDITITALPTLELLGLRYMVAVLERCKGNRTHAAPILGVDRRTIIRMIAKARTLGLIS